MLIAPDLLEILVCPACHSTLFVDEAARELICNSCALAFAVTPDGIPNMLIDQARAIS